MARFTVRSASIRAIALSAVVTPISFLVGVASAPAQTEPKIVLTLYGRIFIMDGNGRHVKGATHQAYQRTTSLSCSADGSRIAFVNRPKETGALHTIRTDGSELRPIAEGKEEEIENFRLQPEKERLLREPQWSPDNSRVAFTLEDG